MYSAGSLTSHQWMLDNLSINGIKWLLPADWRTSLPALMAPLQQATQAPSLRIKQLAIRHTSLTDSNAEWPWQISGLNLDGHDLTLMENGQWGLWHGELTSGAQLVSLNTVEMQAPWVDMSAKEATGNCIRPFCRSRMAYWISKVTGITSTRPAVGTRRQW